MGQTSGLWSGSQRAASNLPGLSSLHPCERHNDRDTSTSPPTTPPRPSHTPSSELPFSCTLSVATQWICYARASRDVRTRRFTRCDGDADDDASLAAAVAQMRGTSQLHILMYSHPFCLLVNFSAFDSLPSCHPLSYLSFYSLRLLQNVCRIFDYAPIFIISIVVDGSCRKIATPPSQGKRHGRAYSPEVSHSNHKPQCDQVT